jgi:magnesium chelatase subunit I
VQGLVELAQAAGVPPDASPALRASGVDFVLEGLFALKKIGRSDERGYHATESPVRRPREDKFKDEERTIPSIPQGKKKYYN